LSASRCASLKPCRLVGEFRILRRVGEGVVVRVVGVRRGVLHAPILLFQRRRFNTGREVFVRAKCGLIASEIGYEIGCGAQAKSKRKYLEIW
jgi:hypothetical protein